MQEAATSCSKYTLRRLCWIGAETGQRITVLVTVDTCSIAFEPGIVKHAKVIVSRLCWILALDNDARSCRALPFGRQWKVAVTILRPRGVPSVRAALNKQPSQSVTCLIKDPGVIATHTDSGRNTAVVSTISVICG